MSVQAGQRAGHLKQGTRQLQAQALARTAARFLAHRVRAGRLGSRGRQAGEWERAGLRPALALELPVLQAL